MLSFRSDDADSRDFATFMRFFCTRMVQAVVQARMGKLRSTPCAPNSDQNWFNLVIDELGEIAAHLKSTIGRKYVITQNFMYYLCKTPFCWSFITINKFKCSVIHRKFQLYHWNSYLTQRMETDYLWKHGKYQPQDP